MFCGIIIRLIKNTLNLQAAEQVPLTTATRIESTNITETLPHEKRTSALLDLFGQIISATDQYPELDTSYLSEISTAGAYHDIGKCQIPDEILFKQGKLNPIEQEQVRRHVTYGRRIIEHLYAHNPTRCTPEQQQILLEGVEDHHEKWNGTGYPRGLTGTEIPFPARMLAIIDVYDAMRSRRAYKKPISELAVKTYFVNNASKHFDPTLTQIFLANFGKFEELLAQLNQTTAQPRQKIAA